MALAEMAYCIDPTRDTAKQTPCDPVPNSPSSHPQLHELRAANNPVLGLRQVSNATVQRTSRTLCMPDVHNVRLDGHAPILAG